MPTPQDANVTVLNGGNFRMDGGCMFGVIPKTIWEKKTAADENNRIAMQSTCVLVRNGQTNILIDTGYGTKHGAKFGENHVLDNPHSLLEELRSAGLEPGQIDFVILSHLHFDHAGGCTYRDENDVLRPQFPNARYLIHRNEWEDATSARPEFVGAYFEDDIMPLKEANLVDLVEDGHEVAPGVNLQFTGGHTRGHQIVHIESGGECFAFLSDFCPTAAHLPPFWTLAYDQDHLHLRRTKPEILGKLADRDAVVIFGHDPVCPAARIMHDERRGFCVREVVGRKVS